MTAAVQISAADGPVVTANFADMVGLLHAQYIVRVWAQSQGFATCNDSNTRLQHPHSGIILEWADNGGDSNQQNVTAQFAFRYQ